MSQYIMHHITPESPLWPERMAPLPGMPHELYYIGSLPEEHTPTIGIIGSRLCSSYGHRTAEEFARAFASRGVQTISGMAVGIDGYAQEASLQAGGKSFAVLGSGADVCYPPGNGRLYDELCLRGGVISELKPGTPPRGPNFASRNRIISALSDILLVVEAKMKSGTNITVEFALSQGKTVYAVPGRVGDHLSDGCNYLISQGAGIAFSPEAVLSELGLVSSFSFGRETKAAEAGRRKKDRDLAADQAISPEERDICRGLSFEDPLPPDALARSLSLPVSRVLAALTDLVLRGYAEEPVRGLYIRKRR